MADYTYVDRFCAALAGVPLYSPLKKPKSVLSEIIKRNPSKQREIEMLVHSGAIWERVWRRLYRERDLGNV